MMSIVIATKTSKIQSVLQDFAEEFMKIPNNELYCNLYSCTVTSTNAFLWEVIKMHPNIKKRLAADLNY